MDDVRRAESAMRTGAGQDDEDPNAENSSASDNWGLVPGPQMAGPTLATHHLNAAYDSENRGRLTYRHGVPGRPQMIPSSGPPRTQEPFAPRMGGYFRDPSPHSPVRSGRYGTGHHPHHPYQSDSRPHLTSEHSLPRQSSQRYAGNFPTSYGREAQSDSGLRYRVSPHNPPTHERDAYSVGNGHSTRYSMAHGPEPTSLLNPQRYDTFSTDSEGTLRAPPTDMTSLMDITSGIAQAHQERYPVARRTDRTRPDHLDPHRYEKMGITRTEATYELPLLPFNSQLREQSASAGPSNSHRHTHNVTVIAIPPYLEPVPQAGAEEPVSELIPLGGEELGRVIGPNAQRPSGALTTLLRIINDEFIRGILENGPSFLKNSNFGEGYKQAVIRSFNVGIKRYEAGPNRGVLNTATGDASFAKLREQIPGLRVGKMHTTLSGLLEGSIGNYYPDMKTPSGIDRGSWQELQRNVNAAVALLGPAGENHFLHKLENGRILRYQNAGLEAFIIEFLFSSAGSLGIRLPEAFIKLSPWIITYCSILVWYECKCLADNKTRPKFFPPEEWQGRFDKVLAEVLYLFKHDKGLNQFALDVPARGRAAYANQLEADLLDKKARADARELVKQQKKLDNAKKAADTRAAVAAGKRRALVGSNSAPWTGSSLDGALGSRSSPNQ